MGFSITLGGPELVECDAAAICRLCDEVFSGPQCAWEPEESHRHGERLAGLSREPGFSIAVATDEQLVGFAYGSTLPVDHRWWSGLELPPPDAVTAEWEGHTFGFVDLAVSRFWGPYTIDLPAAA